MKELTAPFVDNSNRRQSSLVSAVTFDVAIGASETTAYTGLANQFFLIRKLAIVNRTGGGIATVVNIGATAWYSATVATLTTDVVDELSGFLLAPSTNISATGENVRIVGWGIRVEGSEGWTL